MPLKSVIFHAVDRHTRMHCSLSFLSRIICFENSREECTIIFFMRSIFHALSIHVSCETPVCVPTSHPATADDSVSIRCRMLFQKWRIRFVKAAPSSIDIYPQYIKYSSFRNRSIAHAKNNHYFQLSVHSLLFEHCFSILWPESAPISKLLMKR